MNKRIRKKLAKRLYRDAAKYVAYGAAFTALADMGDAPGVPHIDGALVGTWRTKAREAFATSAVTLARAARLAAVTCSILPPILPAFRRAEFLAPRNSL